MWHGIGIMGTGTWDSEQSLFHCSAGDLLSSFDQQAPILTMNPTGPGNTHPQKHAPFVVHHAGVYHLFYRRPPGSIFYARSNDPNIWPDLGEVVFEEADARDVCILTLADEFWMYYCQSAVVAGTPRSTIMVRRSPDLRHWSQATVAHVDTIKIATHSHLESPFVLKRPEGFYLFIRHRLLDERCVTVVLFSDRPDQFPGGDHAWFCEMEDIHAPEIITYEGKYYLARVSGPPHSNSKAPLHGGWVEIAQLKFHPERGQSMPAKSRG